MVFTEKYKEIKGPRIVTDLDVEFTTFIPGKSKSKIAPTTQKSRHNAEIPVMASNQPMPTGRLGYIRYRLGWLMGFEPTISSSTERRFKPAKLQPPYALGGIRTPNNRSEAYCDIHFTTRAQYY